MDLDLPLFPVFTLRYVFGLMSGAEWRHTHQSHICQLPTPSTCSSAPLTINEPFSSCQITTFKANDDLCCSKLTLTCPTALLILTLLFLLLAALHRPCTAVTLDKVKTNREPPNLHLVPGASDRCCYFLLLFPAVVTSMHRAEKNTTDILPLSVHYSTAMQSRGQYVQFILGLRIKHSKIP